MMRIHEIPLLRHPPDLLRQLERLGLRQFQNLFPRPHIELSLDPFAVRILGGSQPAPFHP